MQENPILLHVASFNFERGHTSACRTCSTLYITYDKRHIASLIYAYFALVTVAAAGQG